MTLEGLIADHRSFGDGETEHSVRAELLLELGNLYLRSYRIPSAQACLDEALDLYRAVGARLGEANVLKAMGDVFSFRKENDAALDAYRQALDLYRAVGARLGEANVLSAVGQLHVLEEPEKAEDLLNQALMIYRVIGDRYSTAAQIGNFGWTLRRLGAPDRARPYLLRAAELFEDMGLLDYAERHYYYAKGDAADK